MAKLSKAQTRALRELLDELETVRAWMDDTGYPRSSRLHFEETVKAFEEAFAVQEDLTPVGEAK